MRTFLFLLLFLNLVIPLKSNAGWNPELFIKEYVEENYPWNSVNITNITFDKGIPDERPEKISVIKPPPGKSIFMLEFKNGKKIEVMANIRAFEEVVFSRRFLSKGSVLQDKDLYITLMDVTKLPQGYINSIEIALGKSLARSIIANKPLTESMLVDSTVIKKGQRVLVMASSKNLRITTVGETLENASVGSYVKVLNIATRKVIKGLLIDENTVSVEF
jgi:flagella basal body P-ring formation protein FlgA